MTWLIALGLAGLSVGIQVWPRLTNRYFGVDTWRHLAVADYIRRHRRYPGLMPEKYLIDEPCDYPPLFRYVLALVPRQVLEEYQWLVSPGWDAVHSLVIFALARTMTGNPMVGWVAQAVYATTPIVIMENASLTTRSCASLLFTVTAASLIAWVLTRQWGWGAAGVAGVAVLVLTHRMALQALVVFALGMGVWSRSWGYPAGLLAGLAVAAVLSRGFYLKVLAGHVAMLTWWRGNIHHRYAHQVRGLPKTSTTTPDMVFQIYQSIRKAPWVAVVGADPWAAVVLGVGTWAWRVGRWDPFGVPPLVAQAILQWCAVLWMAAVAIRMIKAIEFIGEGERYLEYAAAPVALLTSLLLWSWLRTPWSGWVLAGALVVGLVGGLLPTLFIQQTVILKDTDRSVTPTLRRMFDQINTCQGDGGEVRLATFPLYLADATMYFTKARVLSTDSSFGHLRHYTPFFPVLQVPVRALVERYRLTHLLINERFVQLPELHLEPTAVIARESPFCLLDARKAVSA